MATVEIATEDLARKLVDAMNRRDINAFTALITPDAEFTSSLRGETLRGRDAVAKWLATVFRAFPDIDVGSLRSIAKGDTVASEGVLTGTHQGPFELPTGTLAPTNKRVELPLAMFFRVNNRGLATELRSYSDTATLVKQLGFKPPGGT